MCQGQHSSELVAKQAECRATVIACVCKDLERSQGDCRRGNKRAGQGKDCSLYIFILFDFEICII